MFEVIFKSHFLLPNVIAPWKMLIKIYKYIRSCLCIQQWIQNTMVIIHTNLMWMIK